MSLHPKANHIFLWSILVYLVCFFFAALSVYLYDSFVYLDFNPTFWSMDARRNDVWISLILSCISTLIVFLMTDHPLTEVKLK